MDVCYNSLKYAVKLGSFVRNCNILQLNTTAALRQYSQYRPEYVEPTYRKEELEEMIKKGEHVKLKATPMKAAKANTSCSVLYDVVVLKFINYTITDGRKALARDLIYETLLKIKQIQLQRYNSTDNPEEKSQIILDPLLVMKKGIANCRPLLKLCPTLRGGVTYQVPSPISERESTFVAMRWLVRSCRERRTGIRYPVRLSKELVDASENKGRVVRQKLELHKICEANRAYAHYRW